MTISRLRFSDILDGAALAWRQQLSSAVANSILNALRAIDSDLAKRGTWQWTDFGVDGEFGFVSQAAGGMIISLGERDSFRGPRAVVSPFDNSLSSTLPGSITITAVPGLAYSPTLTQAMFVNATSSYITGAANATFGSAVTLPSSITSAGDLVWSVGGANFVVVGTDGSGYGRIGYTADGASWSASSGSPATDSAWGGNGRLATNGASAVLAVPTSVSNPSIWYSTDGGESFTKYATGLATSSALRGPCWDPYRSLWLVCLRNNYVYSCANPTSGTWTLAATMPTGFVVDDMKALPDGRWLVAGDDGLIQSTDGGTTWEVLGASLTGTRIALVDGRVALYGDGNGWLSGLY
jgi:hypothetical protein